MNACSERCGWCGRCTAAPFGDTPPDFPMPAACDACGSMPVLYTLASVGQACSRACMNALAQRHEAALFKRGA